MKENLLYRKLKVRDYPDVLGVQHVQTYPGIGRAAVYRLLRSGELKGFKIGNIYKIPKESLVEYVNQSTARNIEEKLSGNAVSYYGGNGR